MKFNLLFRSARVQFAGLGVFAAALVGYSVWASAHGAAPCPLCIFQRMLFMVFAMVALLGALAPSKLTKVVGGLGALVALGGFGVAGYQCFMQAYPEVVATCNYANPSLIEQLVDWAGMQYPTLFMATGFCDVKTVVFWGLSWPQLSAAAFLLLGGCAAAAGGLLARRPRG